MTNPLSYIKKELEHFNSFEPNVKKLLSANFLYSFAISFMNIFVNAYIWAKTDNSTVMIYNIGMYIGLPVIFTLNGYFLRFVSIKSLYSFGMVASSGTIFYMMWLKEYSTLIFFFTGFLIGIAYGLHWANRNYLIMASTTNENRNYYTGTEFMLVNIAFLLSPLLSGAFINFGTSAGLYEKDMAYMLLIGLIFIICAVAAWFIISGTYKTPKLDGKLIYFKFESIWKKMQVVTFFKGALQGAQIILPTLLIMNLVGEEGELGLITSISAVIASITVYIMGRIAKPDDRVKIMIASVIILFIAAMVQSLLFSAITVLVWSAVQALHDPIFYEAYNPMWYRAMDVSSKNENKPRYSFVINNEIVMNLGRIIGIGIFLMFDHYASEEFALRYFLLVVAGMMFFVIPAARKLPN